MTRRRSRKSQFSTSVANWRKPQRPLSAATMHLESLEDRTLLAAFAPGELLVQFDPTADAASRAWVRSLLAGALVEEIQTDAMRTANQGVLERIALGDAWLVERAAAQVSSLPGVVYAEPNWVYSTTEVSNDTYYLNGNLWGMYSSDSPSAVGPSGTTNAFGSQAERAWNNGFLGSRDVYIGVIDEGFQYTHPDLAANAWANPFDPIDGVDNDGNGKIDDSEGWDFFNGDRTVYDGTGDDHGTHVAGTIGGVGGNGAGVAGVNWNVTMISAKFLGPGGGYTSGAIQALDYLTDLKTRHGLNIVATNNSWGGGGFSQGLLDAITRAANQGILFVAAAGNSGSNNDSSSYYPANYNTTSGAGYDAVIAVASITSSGARSSFSSYGATTVDLGAPGSSIYSTLPTNGYGSYSGTSMATPHVTGALALYASEHPGATAASLRSALLSSVTPTTSLSGITVSGGRLNVDTLMGAGVAVPGLAIDDRTVSEGNNGSIFANFTVTLSATSNSTVTVNYATVNGSASAGSDYAATSGTLSFAPGETSKSIPVEIFGDTLVEGNETFTVQLSGATNANLTDASGQGTIQNDDAAAAATLSINDVSQLENQTSFVFTVSLSGPSSSTVTVRYATANGTATGGNGRNRDFNHKSGTLTFNPGQLAKTVSISIRNDKVAENDETFFVNLSSPVGATLADGSGLGTIRNDDGNGLTSSNFAAGGAGDDASASEVVAAALPTVIERSRLAVGEEQHPTAVFPSATYPAWTLQRGELTSITVELDQPVAANRWKRTVR